MIAVGIGCRKDCPPEDIVALVRTALAKLPEGTNADGLFSINAKENESGIAQAAKTIGLPLTFLDQAVLRLVAGDARSCSRRVEEMYGLPGIAETAALAGAGQGATLLVARLANRTTTCAIAGPVSLAVKRDQSP